MRHVGAPKKRFKDKNIFTAIAYLTDELEMIAKYLAKRRGMSVSTYLRTLLIEDARREGQSLDELDKR